MWNVRFERSLLLVLLLCAGGAAAQSGQPAVPSPADSAQTVEDTLVVDTSWAVPEPAVEVKQGPLERDMITSTGVVRVLAPVTGDLLVAGGEVVVNTFVSGDIWAAGGMVEVSGSCNGDLRVAALRASLNGVVRSAAVCFSSTFVEGAGSEVWGDLSLHSSKARIEGTVYGQLRGSARVLVIDGSAKGGVVVAVEKLVVGPKAVIEGDLVYKSAEKATISETARILGSVIHEEPEEKGRARPGVGGIGTFTTGMRLVWFLGMVVVGLIFSVVAPGLMVRVDESLRASPFVSLLAGFVLLVCVPVGLLVLLVLVVGWPLMVLLGALYLMAIVFSGVFAGLSVGRAILIRIERAQKSIFWPMALGLLILFLVSSIPIVGFLIRFFVIMFGLGAVWISHWRHFRQRNAPRSKA